MLNYTALSSDTIRVDWGSDTMEQIKRRRHFENFVTKEIGFLNRDWHCKRVIQMEWAKTFAVDYQFKNPTDLTLILLKYKYENI